MKEGNVHNPKYREAKPPQSDASVFRLDDRTVIGTCYNRCQCAPKLELTLAVQQLARPLAAEWGSRVNVPLIRVNSLSPGYNRTEATAEALQKPGMEEQWIWNSLLYRLSTVDEFRAPVLFLLGDGSSYMTGANLRVDGGHCAW